MEETIGMMMAQVSRLIRRSFDERAREIGVTRPQWQVLSVLGRSPGINQGSLAEILEVEPITAGRMIDRLQEAGLVERRADPADRRAWLLHLTDRGEDLRRRIRPLAAEALDEALEGISARDRAHLVETLQRMRSNLSRNVVHDEAVANG